MDEQQHKAILKETFNTRDASAADRAAEFGEKGFANVKDLGDGVEGWRSMGFPIA